MPVEIPPNEEVTRPPAEKPSSAPGKIGRELGWYFSLFLVLLVACMPGLLCSLYYLSTVPDVTWRRGDLAYTRIWMVHQAGPIGLALENRQVRGRPSADQACVQTTVHYFFWRKPETVGRNSRYSQRYTRTDRGWQSTGQSCP